MERGTSEWGIEWEKPRYPRPPHPQVNLLTLTNGRQGGGEEEETNDGQGEGRRKEGRGRRKGGEKEREKRGEGRTNELSPRSLQLPLLGN